MDLLRLLGPVLLSLVAAAAIDVGIERRGLLPPRFRRRSDGVLDATPGLRRGLAFGLMAFVLYVAVFSPLSLVGQGVEPDLDEVSAGQLFVVHGLLLGAMVVWFVLAHVPGREPGGGWREQFGLRAARPGVEIALGAAAGVAVWLVVIALLVFLSLLIAAFGGAGALPQGPPPMVLWMAGLPVSTRILAAISAGVFEEAFFRGFLQPRVGAIFATVLFTLAHLSYQQPLMLVGIAVLSVAFAALVAWRQSIWAAVTAHAVFDLVQLLVVLPLGARALG